jgi:mRNA interferase MazF
MEMKRGDLVTAAIPGDYGKPRPALVIQDDAFNAIPSVTVLPLTSDLQAVPLLRITVEASSETGLERQSQIMVDKVTTISRAKVGARIGNVNVAVLRAASTDLTKFFGLV